MAKESIWTDAIITKMRELAVTGMKSSEIAAAIGISKNAVLGKAHREGIRLLSTPPKFIVRRTCAAADMQPPAALPHLVPPVFVEAPLADPALVGGCAWLDRARGGWIECDAPPLRREFYCEKHCRVAFPDTGKKAA